MKSAKILASAITALAFAGAAQAATFHVYITGSTAFRSQTQSSLATLFGAPQAQSNGTLASADAALFKKVGYPTPSDTTYVKTCFLGSTGGIQTTAGSLPVPFYSDAATGTLTRPDTIASGNANREDHIPDLTMGDSYQSATLFNGTFQGVTYEDLSAQDIVVGVLTFKWIGSKNFPAGHTFTNNLAQTLFANGRLPLSAITGSGTAGDKSTIVFATGRSIDSGTRTVALAESGVGAVSVVKQWKPTISSGSVTSQQLYPVEILNGVSSQFLGNSGEISGSTLRNNMTATIPSTVYNNTSMGGKASTTGAFYLTYLGTSDAASVAANTTELKWNGVAFSELAVQQGSYTFWSYQHIFYRQASVGTVAETVAQDLAAQITAPTTVLSPNVKLSDMQVERSVDGGLIAPAYSF